MQQEIVFKDNILQILKSGICVCLLFSSRIALYNIQLCGFVTFVGHFVDMKRTEVNRY
jgi:hypothetical protein